MLTALVPTVAAAAPRDTATTCPAPLTHVFTDVPVSATHRDPIACLVHHAIAHGRTGTTFGPQGELRRDQLAAFLARTLDAASVALPEPSREHFTDLDDNPHRAAIERLAGAGILPTGSTEFRPHVRANRAEMAERTAAALRYAGVLRTTDLDLFTDDDGTRSEQAIDDLAAAGVVSGLSVGQFAPHLLVRRDQMATFLVGALDLIVDGGTPPERPPTLPVVRSAEGWAVAGGDGPIVGHAGTITRYSVEVADGLDDRQDVPAFARVVETTLSHPERGWTSMGAHRLQRVDEPTAARIRVVLATPRTVDRLCGAVGLDTAGIYSCWTGRIAAINADRWFGGVAHVADLALYRGYLINHEVGHGLGYGHRSCPGPGMVAPVMMQLTKSTYGCVPNAWPFP